MMVSACYDGQGELRGVIQLSNKLAGSITEQDLTEFDSLMPALGEILKTADDIRQFSNVSSSVHAHLLHSDKQIQQQLRSIEENMTFGLSTNIKQARALVNDLITMKKRAILSD